MFSFNTTTFTDKDLICQRIHSGDIEKLILMVDEDRQYVYEIIHEALSILDNDKDKTTDEIKYCFKTLETLIHYYRIPIVVLLNNEAYTSILRSAACRGWRIFVESIVDMCLSFGFTKEKLAFEHIWGLYNALELELDLTYRQFPETPFSKLFWAVQEILASYQNILEASRSEKEILSLQVLNLLQEQDFFNFDFSPMEKDLANNYYNDLVELQFNIEICMNDQNETRSDIPKNTCVNEDTKSSHIKYYNWVNEDPQTLKTLQMTIGSILEKRGGEIYLASEQNEVQGIKLTNKEKKQTKGTILELVRFFESKAISADLLKIVFLPKDKDNYKNSKIIPGRLIVQAIMEDTGKKSSNLLDCELKFYIRYDGKALHLTTVAPSEDSMIKEENWSDTMSMGEPNDPQCDKNEFLFNKDFTSTFLNNEIAKKENVFEQTTKPLSKPLEGISKDPQLSEIGNENKQDTVEGRQNTFMIGKNPVVLKKLLEAQTEVDELTVKVQDKKKELAIKQEESDQLLKEITKSMQEVAEFKQQTEILPKTLEDRSKAIESSKKNIEAELNGIYPLVDQAKCSVAFILRRDLEEIRAFRFPPESIVDVFTVVMMILGEKDTSWSSIRRFLGSRVTERILDFDPNRLATGLRVEIEKEISKRERSFEKGVIYRASIAAGSIADWVIAILKYAEVLEKIQPLAEEKSELEKKLENFEIELRESQKLLEELEVKVSQLKDNFEQKTSEAEDLKIELKKTEESLVVAQDWLNKLTGEKSKWNGWVKQLELEL